MRNRFDRELELLNTELIEMGLLIENAIKKAVEALINKDEILAKEAINFDEIIDEKEKEIESRCLKILLQQQPVASDLRLVSTALKMITDMERIGDHASDISEITLRLKDKEYIKNLEHVHQMAQATTKMVKDSIDAFVARDLVLAYEVEDYDDVVDDLFNTVKNELIALIRENAESGEQAVDLLMVAKYFERIGDHAVNIAEWVAFSITGKHKNERIL
ncbi:phosphate signaling complex protein PhoU [Proteiniborus sp. MB09-C3]|uniref:phosphate signaling complex protein PhoU n=1 Tax=Proteiniborus sp. MB09-C3 TaxID=3050072 RepID=UPI002554DC86|nr:phosphate signaling complex protein PhoU [Proteiniborus sp. MB09-C3]WIV11358.1 phosphate signaling complex protein PhoU [Proteiniborus sp. MB09-C3]